MSKFVHVWTDGGCLGNPGPMGIGMVVTCGDERREMSIFLGEGTNNIAELRAIEHGLALARSAFGDDCAFRIYSDSAYAIGILSKPWKPKANQVLVARIREGLRQIPGRVEFVKVRGHAGVAENERCDELATAAIASGVGAPVVVDTVGPPAGSALPACPLCGSKCTSHKNTGDVIPWFLVVCSVELCQYEASLGVHRALCELAAKARAWDALRARFALDTAIGGYGLEAKDFDDVLTDAKRKAGIS